MDAPQQHGTQQQPPGLSRKEEEEEEEHQKRQRIERQPRYQKVHTLMERREERVKKIKEVKLLPGPHPSLHPHPQPFYDYVKKHNHWIEYTNFTEAEFTDLWQRMLVYEAKASHRGPAGKIVGADALLLMLVYYKSGMCFAYFGSRMRVRGTWCCSL